MIGKDIKDRLQFILNIFANPTHPDSKTLRRLPTIEIVGQDMQGFGKPTISIVGVQP